MGEQVHVVGNRRAPGKTEPHLHLSKLSLCPELMMRGTQDRQWVPGQGAESPRDCSDQGCVEG
jgi:hypothetical protein